MSTEIFYADLGHALADRGTEAYRTELEELAAAVRLFAPGAAEAVTDWAGTEVARLRAYAVARSVLVEQAIAARLVRPEAFHDRHDYLLLA